MENIANLSDLDRSHLFRNTADKMKISDAIVEKDFWVCFLLDYLFHHSAFKDSIAFKGGTSLSKAFNLIRRFSEDVDLILDWRILGYDREEPWTDRTANKQDQFNRTANLRAEQFIAETFLPGLKAGLDAKSKHKMVIHIDSDDRQTVIFAYPRLFSTPSTLQVIRLEIGALAAWTPARKATIAPYAAGHYPHLFNQPSTQVLTVNPERTFWEKATILHQEANRPEEVAMPLRYYRHYYDLYMMIHSEVKESALSNLQLLEQVTEFKMKFYPRKWARYPDIYDGKLKLFPPGNRLPALKKDFHSMKEMFFGDIPSFDSVMKTLMDLEDEIRELYQLQT
ncbi:MAG TPA: nucleotidyl transferase AbiEii/AbiGii toxin family protein [Clostridiaceae bacterium]|nr:nucleotidyl transferase AbiEii/AbiGii toxin family protein [Clostridiaceae bacterium]